MNETLTSFWIPALLVATLAVVGTLVSTTIYRRYTGLTRGQSALLWLLAIGLAVGLMVYKRNEFYYQRVDRGLIEDFTPIDLICLILPLLALPFSIKLYRKWIGAHLIEAEKLPGIDGVRTWLGVGNIICAIFIPICVWQFFGYSPFAIAVLTFGLLLAYPLLNMASQSTQPAPVAPAEDLSNEREKVLQLLEAGKISAVESAELLNALGHSALPPPKPAVEVNLERKAVWLGAAFLLVGFFLPWFIIKPGAMLNEAASQLQQNMNRMMPGNVMPQMNFPLQTETVQVHAGDLAHGLGWWILALGMIPAVLPFFATNLEPSVQKKIILAVLGIGVILLVYLLSDSIRYVDFGLPLVLTGYALELLGTLRERPAAR